MPSKYPFNMENMWETGRGERDIYIHVWETDIYKAVYLSIYIYIYIYVYVYIINQQFWALPGKCGKPTNKASPVEVNEIGYAQYNYPYLG